MIEPVEPSPVRSPSKHGDSTEPIDEDFGDDRPEYFAVQAAKLQLKQVQANSPIVNTSILSLTPPNDMIDCF